MTSVFQESLAVPEDIHPGDFVLLAGDLGWREVDDVVEYEDDIWVVSYRDLVLNGWDYGRWVRVQTTAARPFIKQLRQFRSTELVTVRKVI